MAEEIEGNGFQNDKILLPYKRCASAPPASLSTKNNDVSFLPF